MNFVRKQNQSGRMAMHTAVFIVFIFWLTITGVSPASITFNTLANFNGTNGNNPNHTALIQATDGNLWGNTVNGGANGQGMVFKISPSGTLTPVYNFCSLASCADGGNPYGPLVQASNGIFYGTTSTGGANHQGTVFKLTLSGTLTTVYSFCSQTSCTDGASPLGILTQDSAGNLYGTTNLGGASNDGTAFKLTPAGVLTTLHSFTGADGANPIGGVISASGTFYGTTQSGGTNGDGTVFTITSTGTFASLHSFAGTDGATPSGWMVDIGGTFYGSTASGGANGQGTVFKMTSAGTVTTLYNFCSLASCADGSQADAGLMQATDGNLYGLTSAGGANGDGTAYKLTLKGVLTTLHSFDGTDGNSPVGGLVQDTNGEFYGLTSSGGANGDGTAFSIATGLKAFVTLQSTSGKVGSKVGILGDGFSSSSVVKFNEVTATAVTLTEPGLLIATVPTGATDGFVTVTTGSTTLTSAQKYTVHNSWASGTAMPVAVNWPVAGVIGTKAYVVGGYTGGPASADNQIYNLGTNTWTSGAALPAATAQAAAAVVSSTLYVFGGSNNGGGTVFNSVWAYDPTTNAWSSKTAMPTARCSAAAVVANGLVYVIGGFSGGNRLNTVEAYNPITDSWTEEAPLINGKSEISAGLISGTIVAADGFTSSGDNGDNQGYDVSTNTWSALAADPTARNGACSGAIGSLLYVADGNVGSNAPVSLMESFSPSQNKWTTLTAMPQTATDIGSAVSGGQLYCFGGGNWAVPPNNTVYNYVQIYQP